MFTIKKLTGAALLAGLVALGPAVSQAHAQFFRQRTLGVYSSGVNPNAPFYNPLMPTYRAGPGTSMQQAMFNQFAPLRAASRLPPWIYGYNPYPSPIYYSPTPYVPMYNPYNTYVPYANPYVSGYFNPYAYPPAVYANPYSALY